MNNHTKSLKVLYDQLLREVDTDPFYTAVNLPHYNEYICKGCGTRIKTVEHVAGVTPMFISCPTCKKGICQSTFGTIWDVEKPATMEWYRPTFEEFCKSPNGRTHVLQGGLCLREIKPHQHDTNKS